MRSSASTANEARSGERAIRVVERGAVRLFVVTPRDGAARELDAPDLPDGFDAPSWRAPTLSRAELGRGGAGVIAWGDGRAFWRPLRRGGALAGLLGDAYWTPSRLEREMRDALRLQGAGVRVARPILGRAERAGLRWRLGLVSELLQGETLDARLQATGGVRARRALLRRAGEEVARMHEAGFEHPDLHPGNLFALDGGGVAILDLTGGRWGGDERAGARQRGLVRCARWWHKHRAGLPALRDALAFLQGYEGARAARHALLASVRVALLRQLRRRRRAP